MNAIESIRQALDYFRQQRQAKLEEIRGIELTIRQLERELGEAPSTTNGGTEDLSASADPTTSSGSGGPRLAKEVRPDEFFSLPQTEAAKAFLRKVGNAVSFDQLVEGLKKGGAQVGGADPKKTLYVSLMRNPKKEFVLIGDGFIGLATSTRTSRNLALQGELNARKT